MSVDITGSTQFKQSLSLKTTPAHKDDPDDLVPSEPWLSPILEFYEQITAVFEETWSSMARHARDERHDWTVGERPTVWKAVGDELIFTKVLKDHREAYLCVLAWLETVKTYRKRIKIHSAGLDLKCAAWIAGFPINNAEVILDHHGSSKPVASDDGDYIFGNLARLFAATKAGGETATSVNADGGVIRDFIGPSIDTGFRVASVSSPRRFVVSADLAFMLAHTAGNLPSTWDYKPLVFYYDGRRDLKGVTNGTPYPIFWVNAIDSDPLMAIEDQLEKRQPTPASEIKLFCELFLEKNKDTHVMKPFIIGDMDAFFKRMPERHQQKLLKLANYWERESARRVAEEKAQLEPGETGESSADDKAAIEKLSSQLASGMHIGKGAPAKAPQAISDVEDVSRKHGTDS